MRFCLAGSMTRHLPRPLAAVVAAAVIVGISGCAGRPPSAPSRTGDPLATSRALIGDRLDALDDAVAEWADASTLDGVTVAAEAARNLVVGPNGPGYGDANGDGVVSGESSIGLLPGLDGEPGLVASDPQRDCVGADVLGGSWEDPAARWQLAVTAAEEWTPRNNPFPTLPSHPQRVYGWATLALGESDLDAAVEFASHARLHVDITRSALATC